MKTFVLIFISLFLTTMSFQEVNAQKRTTKARTQKPIPVVPIPSDTALYNRALMGNADAQAFVGLLYYGGEGGVPENDTEAVRWFRKSNNGNSPYGRYWLGVAYSNGIGSTNCQVGDKMIEEGIELIRARAEVGDSLAQYWLGNAYEIGNVSSTGDEDYKNAIKWYVKAGDNGYIEGYCAAADCYKQLYGSKSKRAFELFKLASDKGFPRGQYEFSQYYFQGLGVPQSYEEELKLLIKAAEGGNKLAEYQVAEHYELGFGTELNIQEAINRYSRIGADYKMGCFYRDGVGVDRNYDKAIKYFKDAVKNGDTKAKLALQYMQKQGRAYYASLPKRNPDDYYIIKDGDPFSSMRLSANWGDLNDYMKAIYLRHFKEEKFLEWGEKIANQVANHAVEIGFNKEQLYYSQGYDYETQLIHTPNGDILAMKYPHCTYFLMNDKLFAMIWKNGMQVGDVRLIETYAGDYVITTGNK